MKKTDIDKAIEKLENDRAIIDAALEVLVRIRSKAPAVRRPRVVKKADEKTA